MNPLLIQLIDLVDILNLEPSETEPSFEFFDRAVCRGLDEKVITDAEADAMAAYLNEVAA